MLDLRNMDCMDLMRQYPDNHFDLAIVDPPYAVGASDGSFGRGGRKSKNHGASIKRSFKHYANHNSTPNKQYFSELFRVSKNQIVWGANYYPEHLIHSGWIVWDKLNTGPLSDCELAFQSINKVVKKVSIRWSGFIKEDASYSDCMIHPNQKPVTLYCWLLSNYAKPGDLILDTHLGSGSIAIACHDLGFDLVASELDADYFAAMQERLARHTAQGNLFKPQIEPEEDVRQDLSLFPAAKPSA